MRFEWLLFMVSLIVTVEVVLCRTNDVAGSCSLNDSPSYTCLYPTHLLIPTFSSFSLDFTAFMVINKGKYMSREVPPSLIELKMG